MTTLYRSLSPLSLKSSIISFCPGMVVVISDDAPMISAPMASASLINVSVFDPNLVEIWYTISSNPTKHFLQNNTEEYLNGIIWANLPQGPFEIYFYANDSAGNIGNQNISLYDYHSKVILMDFTADWCESCREKAETAEQFYQQYKDKEFMYILIVIDGDPAIWADTYGLTFPVLDDNNRIIYNIYSKTSIPLPHVLDRNSTIRYKKEGWNRSEVEEEIKKYL